MWSTLPSRKSIASNKSRSKKMSAPFLLPGGLFSKRQPNPTLFSTPSRSQPPRTLGDRLAGKGESHEKSSPSRKITMFKPSGNLDLPRTPLNKSSSPTQYFEGESSHDQMGSSKDFRPLQEDISHIERIGDLPGTTAISRLLLEAPYSDPLAPPLKQLVWTSDMLRRRAPYVRFRYLRTVEDELEHPPSACVQDENGIHACLFATSPLSQQISDAISPWRVDLSL
jgi:hypothetical protein